MPLNLQINSVYTFNNYAPGILGASLKNARLLFSCNFETAMKYEDVGVQYRQIYPELPPGAPVSPSGVVFHMFKTESGQNKLIAEPWIVSASIVSVTNLNFTVTVVNATIQDKANVRSALAHLGVNFNITDN